jgi:hypothetical protein
MPEYPQTSLDQRMPGEAFFMCRNGDLAAANCSNKLRQPLTLGIFIALILIFLLGVIWRIAGGESKNSFSSYAGPRGEPIYTGGTFTVARINFFKFSKILSNAMLWVYEWRARV